MLEACALFWLGAGHSRVAQGRPGAVRVEPRYAAGTEAAVLRYWSYMELGNGEQSLVAGILYPAVLNEPFLAAVLISAFTSSCVGKRRLHNCIQFVGWMGGR